MEVRPSTIRNAGHGLFAARPFKKNDFITMYAGVLVSGEEIARIEEQAERSGTFADTHSHTKSVNFGSAILGLKTIPAPTGKGGGSYANDGGQERNNCVYTRIGLQTGTDIIVLKATQDIAVDSEVFVSYGATYWASRGLPKP